MELRLSCVKVPINLLFDVLICYSKHQLLGGRGFMIYGLELNATETLDNCYCKVDIFHQNIWRFSSKKETCCKPGKLNISEVIKSLLEWKRQFQIITVLFSCICSCCLEFLSLDIRELHCWENRNFRNKVVKFTKRQSSTCRKLKSKGLGRLRVRSVFLTEMSNCGCYLCSCEFILRESLIKCHLKETVFALWCSNHVLFLCSISTSAGLIPLSSSCRWWSSERKLLWTLDEVFYFDAQLCELFL